MSNFAFLQPEWSMLFEAASRAEEMANSDARVSCFYARRALEQVVAWMYAHDKALKQPYQDNLSALIHEATFKNTVGDALFTKARLIKDLGNMAAHGAKKMVASDAINATRELFHFCYWLARTYGRANRPSPALSFSPAFLPKSTGAPAQSVDQLLKLEADLKARDEKLAAALVDKAALSQELQQLQQQVAAAKLGVAPLMQ